ncbi:MAG: AMP-binding protein [Gammaproteobacteria bacterium]|nr:AMP-binding protein [Gammaproteobacteria bacterium]
MADDLTTIDGCETISALFRKRVAELGDKVVIREKDLGIWNEYSWSDLGAAARSIGLGLKALGLQRGDVCSVASEINKEWMFADLGIIGAGGVTNGVYPTDAPDQVEYLINDSGTRFYFAEDEEQLDKVLEVRERTPTLEKVIIFDMEGLRKLDDEQCMSLEELLLLGDEYDKTYPETWAREIDAARPDDLMVLTYTSGTTGRPKGAMIGQRNMLYMLNVIQVAFEFGPDEQQLGFLPLAHIAGRMFYTFSPMCSCSVVNIVESLETTVQDQQEVSPTVHFAVPRVWEKQFSTVSIKLKEATAPGRFAYDKALAIGKRAAAARQDGRQLSIGLRIANFLAQKLVFKNVKELLGIDRARWLATGAAPISPDLIDWYFALGIPMYEVYGQTECTGLATTNTPDELRVGSIGKAVAGAEVILSDEAEILIRSPGVIAGYWNKPDKTAETIRDGWLHTGDVGRIDEDGFIYILDRLKDIIITAGGKNITPSEIENQLKFSPYISDAVVVGDKRPYLTCLVMIDDENVTKFAQDNDVPFTNYTSLCHTAEVKDLIGGEIEQVNANFARVETIKKFRLIDQLLDAEDEELTPTMKLKRKVVNVKYADLIDSMY